MSRTRSLFLLALLGLAAGAGALVLVLTSDHETNRVGAATIGLLAGWSFVGTGLVAWWRRPENAFGRLMLATGFTWFIGALTEANEPIVFTIGAAFGSLAFAFFIHALLAFPSGRLGSRADRGLVALAWVVV